MHVALRSVLVLLECNVLLAGSWVCSILQSSHQDKDGVEDVASLPSARRTKKLSGRIYGGQEAAPHSHPYIVSLQQNLFFVRVHICGGSLLTEQWVVTAAHCVVGSPLIDWLFPLDAVVAGTHDVVRFDPYAQVSDIDQKIIHPSFNWNTLHNDIAMIRTATAFTLTPQVQPIRLPEDYQITAQPLILVGWGALKTTSFIPHTPRHLQEAIVKYMPHDECYQAIIKVREEVGSRGLNHSDMLDGTVNICSGPKPRGVSGCPGDSGGPLVQYTAAAARPSTDRGDDTVRSVDSKPYPVLIGITSWIVATPCGRSGMPTVYTKVSNYIDFIDEIIKT